MYETGAAVRFDDRFAASRPFMSGWDATSRPCDSTPHCVDKAQLLAGDASPSAWRLTGRCVDKSLNISQLSAHRLNGTTFANGTVAGLLRRPLLGGRSWRQ
jgi:hypothetical protein